MLDADGDTFDPLHTEGLVTPDGIGRGLQHAVSYVIGVARLIASESAQKEQTPASYGAIVVGLPHKK